MKFDELLSCHLGDFGRYQKIIYILVCLPPIWCSMNMFCWTFTSLEVPHRCKLDENDTWSNPSLYSSPNKTELSKCHVKVKHESQNLLEPCQNGYVWDTSEFTSSALVDWQLVCDRSWLKAMAQSIFYVGISIGSLALGYLANVVGRKMVILVGSLLITVASVTCIWSPSVEVFTIFRIVQGFLEPALWQIPFAMGVELVGPSKRMLAGMWIEFFFSGGLVLLGILAYFIRDWKILQITVSAPGFLFALYYWILPESPRWLLAVGRKEEALEVIRKAAKVNGVTIPEETLQCLNEKEENEEEQASKSQTYSYFDLFRTPNLRRKTIICCYCWTTVVFVYYGISLNPSAIGGDFYVSFILSGFVEMPSLVFLILTLNILGRKFLQMAGFLISGIALIITVFVPANAQMVTLILVLVARLSVTAAFCVIYLHTSEIFPTVLRSIAMGLTVTCSRFGGIVSPFASMYLAHSPAYRQLTLLCFGILAIFAAFLTLLLPETAYKKLPETLEDGENFGKDVSICSGGSILPQKPIGAEKQELTC